MHKYRISVKERQEEIYRFLEEVKSISKIVTWSMMIPVILFAMILAKAMVNSDAFLNFIEKEPLSLGVWGNLILIPLKFAFGFWIIYFISNLCIHMLIIKSIRRKK